MHLEAWAADMVLDPTHAEVTPRIRDAALRAAPQSTCPEEATGPAGHARTRVARVVAGAEPQSMEGPVMTKDRLYVGLDTDKKHVDVAVADPLPGGEVRYWGKIANEAPSLDRLIRKLGRDG